VAALCVCAVRARAQEAPRFTVFGGYSFMHAVPGDNGVSLNGWAADATINLTRRFGVAASFSGEYRPTSVYVLPAIMPGSSVVSAGSFAALSQSSVVKHSALIGPEFRPLNNRHLVVRFAGGVGPARSTRDGWVFGFLSSTASPSSTGVAVGGGASADVRLTKRLAYRAVQFKFIARHSDFGWQRSIQLATGLVLNLGH
jgi:hypothetical protein